MTGPEKDKRKPPRLADWLLKHCAGEPVRYGAMGDFSEIFHQISEEKGAARACLWYWRQLFISLPRFLVETLFWSFTMFRNYLLITWRHLCRNRMFSLINIFGLAVGISVCLMIFIWALDERSTDQFHNNIDDLYLVQTWQRYGANREPGQGTPPALGPALVEEYPEVIQAARYNNGQTEMLFTVGDKRLKEQVQLADPALFDLFTFPFVSGDIRDTRADPYVLVLSEDAAARYFGDEDAVGKEILVDNDRSFRVAGVMKNIQSQLTIQFDVWAPLQLTTHLYREDYISTWYNLSFRTYVQLQPGVSYMDFNGKIKDRILRSDPDTHFEPFLFPFKDVYLKLWRRQGAINVFSIIGLFILVIACINFMNLATARSARRVKEIGLRKLVGAGRQQLIRQFMGESILFALMGSVLAILLTYLFLPQFGELMHAPHLSLSFTDNWIVPSALVLITLFTGVVAGSYPAVFLSSFRLMRILGGANDLTGSSGLFRKILVVTQFGLSVILIVCTLVIYKQTDHMKGIDLGYDQDSLVSLRVEGELKKNFPTLKEELLRNPKIQSASVSSHLLTGVYWNGQDWEWEGKDPNINPLVTYLDVDPDFVETFQIKMVAGRFFDSGVTPDSNQIVINESLARLMGTDSPVGRRLGHGEEEGIIIGVVGDFHFKPVSTEIGPLIIYAHQERVNFLNIRINPEESSSTLAFVEQTTRKLNPAFPFELSFLDEQLERMYRGFDAFRSIIQAAAILAILISCLGLFSLAAFMAERRTKELGVRKVLGASIHQLMRLMSLEFLKLILLANIIACPIAFFLMNMWLTNYATRITIGWDIFLVSALMTIVIALITVSYQSYKASRINPVECLQYE